jgi:ketosteroid isomerase-like protein
MSQENVEIALKVIDALNGRDEEAFVECLGPDVQWEENTPIYAGLSRVYRGTAEARAWFNEVIVEFWDAFHFESEETTEGPGGRVLLGGLITARGKGSGVETELRVWGVVWVAEGAITRRQIFLDRDEALEAAGLRE